MGSEKAAECHRKSFPGVKRVPAVSRLALWLRQSGWGAQTQEGTQRGPLLACRALPVARRSRLWSVDFKGWFAREMAVAANR